MNKEKEKRYDEALEIAKKNYITAQDLCEGSQIGVECFKNTLENIFPEPKESEDEKIKKELTEFLKSAAGGFLDTAIQCKTFGKWAAWLKKQRKQEQLYIRFGEIPTDEKSKIYKGEIEVGIENGVSVYPAFKTNEGDIVLGLNLPVTKTTLYTQQHLIEYDNRVCYLVKGDYVGKDTDGQPLINNVSIIEKIDKYRVKEKKQGEQNHYIMEDIPDRLCDDA